MPCFGREIFTAYQVLSMVFVWAPVSWIPCYCLVFITLLLQSWISFPAVRNNQIIIVPVCVLYDRDQRVSTFALNTAQKTVLCAPHNSSEYPYTSFLLPLWHFLLLNLLIYLGDLSWSTNLYILFSNTSEQTTLHKLY